MAVKVKDIKDKKKNNSSYTVNELTEKETELLDMDYVDETEDEKLFEEEIVDHSEELDWFEEELENQSEEAESSNVTSEVREGEENNVLELAIRNTKAKINFDNVILANSKQEFRAFGSPGVITVVDGGKFGRRIAISKDLYVELELEDTVQVAFEDESILMGKFINENANMYVLRTQGAKHMIYCASLVREITQRLELEFARENKTSITFNSVEFDYTLETPIAIIKRY